MGSRRLSWESASVLAIVVLAAWLRLRHLGLAGFGDDQGIALRIAHEILHGDIRTVGLASSSGAANPPLYVYIVAAVIGIHDSVPFANASVAVLSIVAIALTYVVVRPRFGATVALITAALFATAPWAVFSERYLWQQNYLPLVTVSLLWAFFCRARARTHPRRAARARALRHRVPAQPVGGRPPSSDRRADRVSRAECRLARVRRGHGPRRPVAQLVAGPQRQARLPRLQADRDQRPRPPRRSPGHGHDRSSPSDDPSRQRGRLELPHRRAAPGRRGVDARPRGRDRRHRAAPARDRDVARARRARRPPAWDRHRTPGAPRPLARRHLSRVHLVVEAAERDRVT